MRLADFILASREPILAEWEAFARTCAPASGTMDIAALRDHAGEMLAVIAAADAFELAVAAALVAGVAEGPQLAAVFQVRHREAPEALRTQLFTTAASVKMSAFALGSAGAGAVAVHSVTACPARRGGRSGAHSSRTSAP